jgi:group I intron endonuclease
VDTNLIGIYSVTNPAGMRYVGSSRNIMRRWEEHRTRSKVKQMPYLGASMRAFGEENHKFEILILAPAADHDILVQLEQMFVDMLQPKLNCSSNAKSPLRGTRWRKNDPSRKELLTRIEAQASEWRGTTIS